MIAALYVLKNGPYFETPGIDTWDAGFIIDKTIFGLGVTFYRDDSNNGWGRSCKKIVMIARFVDIDLIA